MPKIFGKSKRKQAPTKPGKKKKTSLGKKVAKKATSGIAKQKAARRKAFESIG